MSYWPPGPHPYSTSEVLRKILVAGAAVAALSVIAQKRADQDKDKATQPAP